MWTSRGIPGNVPTRLLPRALVLGVLVAVAWPQALTSQDWLSPELGFFQPLLGKTFRARIETSQEGKVVVDVARWERALNGRAVRQVHSLDDGVYGGETFFVWDREREKVVYYYFTTAGFYTHGTVTVEADGKFSTQERVSGNEGGVRELRATLELLPDGRLRVRSEALHEDGAWRSRPER